MRPVTVFKNDNYVQGVGYQKCEDFKGKFHGWGLEIWEQDTASVSYSVALVEKDDGMVVAVPPHMIRFDVADIPNGCHRSHPHEDMNAECEQKTVDARQANEKASAPAIVFYPAGSLGEEV